MHYKNQSRMSDQPLSLTLSPTASALTRTGPATRSALATGACATGHVVRNAARADKRAGAAFVALIALEKEGILVQRRSSNWNDRGHVRCPSCRRGMGVWATRCFDEEIRWTTWKFVITHPSRSSANHCKA